jgi:hypothetical protein
VICLVAQGCRAHGKFDSLSLDSIGGEDDTTVLSNFTVVSTSASDDHVDVGFFSRIAFKLSFFSL